MMSEAEQLSYVMNELAEIKKILADFVSGTASNDTSNVNLPPSGKEYLTVEEAAALIGSKRSYIYKLTHEKRSDLLDWIEANRIKSQKDVQNDVEQFMKNSRRPGRNAPKR